MLVVSATFTTSFTSLMTNSHIKPSKTYINMLRRTNAAIGYDGSSFVIQYLVKVLGFKPKNIGSIASIDDHAEALASGNIIAAFILMPYAKVLLEKYCTGFNIAGPTYELGGFGFVSPKVSTLAFDMSEAIVRLRVSGGIASNRGKNALLL
ncbi:glutamate receptor 2 plant, putative [Ricinus communis]|uniref:Glutamate receptor 2 plant, putative n=2 Tax=Ricinus communis TaxID=3988 RepID=B9SC63_RICCO|nr:glutamate receptor 2 plant, putative [Ricinus communis]